MKSPVKTSLSLIAMAMFVLMLGAVPQARAQQKNCRKFP